MGVLSGYVGSGYCELTDAERPRPHYQALVSRFDEFDVEDLQSRVRLIDSLFRGQGITFAVYGDEEGVERTWPLDLVPRIISAAEWSHIEQGLIQRIRALNQFLDDICVSIRWGRRQSGRKAGARSRRSKRPSEA